MAHSSWAITRCTGIIDNIYLIYSFELKSTI
jgi:hypothetical protein